MNDGDFRIEHDQIGEMRIPADDLRGIHTHRAAENFAVSGASAHPRLIRAYALVKKACAKTNASLGFLDRARAAAIDAACDEVAAGSLDEWFTLDALQGGAGTSTNMNLNEVIANRANAILNAGRPAAYRDEVCAVDPLAHVNLHQSTNDTYPTALKVCAIGMLRDAASAAAALQGALQKKEKEFAGIVTVGRTELQPAVPMTLGAIFSGLAEAAGRDRWRTFKCEERLRAVNLGGTAVGTGLAAPRDYIFRVTDNLRAITGYGLARAENLVDQTSNADSFTEVAGILASMAANVEKLAGDLRLLAFAGDITLPAVQAGSSIMPGKVNPVICEAVMQAGMKARSFCALVAEAAARGSLQINEFMPLLADSLLSALDLLANAANTLSRHVEGVSANEAACRDRLDRDRMIVTAFLPVLGYEGARALLAKYDEETGQYRKTDSAGTQAAPDSPPSIRAFLERELGTDTVDRILSPANLSSLGHRA
jgi:aspartate ammonia-lyase